MPSSACDWSSDVCSSDRSEEHTSELQSRSDLVCRLLLEKKDQERRLRVGTRGDGGDAGEALRVHVAVVLRVRLAVDLERAPRHTLPHRYRGIPTLPITKP